MRVQKRLYIKGMDVIEYTDLKLYCSDTFIAVIKTNEDGVINHYLAHCPDWDAIDNLLLIPEETYIVLKQLGDEANEQR